MDCGCASVSSISRSRAALIAVYASVMAVMSRIEVIICYTGQTNAASQTGLSTQQGRFFDKGKFGRKCTSGECLQDANRVFLKIVIIKYYFLFSVLVEKPNYCDSRWCYCLFIYF